ncbi:MAG: hypothetical protein M1602_02220 [Firmicutes bacterium]|nr:hypothetical protein [Bacillota bacterium]
MGTEAQDGMIERCQAGDALPAAASGDGPEVSAERLDQRRLMLAAIATLDPSHRAPLVLFYLEGLSESEVAEGDSCLMTGEGRNGQPALDRLLRETLAAGRRARPRGRWGLALGGLGALVVVAGILLFSVRSGGVAPLGSDFGYYPPGIALSDPRLPDTGVRSSKPAPYFPHGFTVTSDPFPPHIGQQVTIVSESGWPGKAVWVYAAPAKEQETIMYDHQLPKNAVLIGVAPIDQTDGHWTLTWTIPNQLSHGEVTLSFDGPDAWFNLAAATDAGCLAGSGLPLGPARTLDVIPEDVAAGQVLTIRGADYPANLKIRLDILHQRPAPQGGTDLEVTIGWVRTDTDGRFSFDYKVPAQANWAYADIEGQMKDHPLTMGAPGIYTILAVEYHDDGFRQGIEKKVGVHPAT